MNLTDKQLKELLQKKNVISVKMGRKITAAVLPDDVVPLPGNFVTDSDLLEQVGQGELSEGWV